MPQSDRPGVPFLERLKNVGRALVGKTPSMQYGLLPPDYQTVFSKEFGLPPTFKPEQSQQAYSDNPWLYSAVNVIAHEVSRTEFRLMLKDKKGELTRVENHQAMDTLTDPQPGAAGGSILTSKQLF